MKEKNGYSLIGVGIGAASCILYPVSSISLQPKITFNTGKKHIGG